MLDHKCFHAVMLDHYIMVLVRYLITCVKEYRIYKMNAFKGKGECKPTYNSNIHTYGYTYKLFSGGQLKQQDINWLTTEPGWWQYNIED